MAAGMNSAFGFSAFDTILPCMSLYHATAWGLPFTAAISGCKFVLPGEKMDAASLHELIAGEGVTFIGGVPTIWTMYLDYLERTGQHPGELKTIMIGGSAVPRSLAEAFRAQHGVEVRQIWGMTETSPLGVIATPTPKLTSQGNKFTDETIWTRAGRLQFGIELRILDEQGNPLPWNGESAGDLQVRGPWVVDRYYPDIPAAAEDGWFDTGDVATIDRFGFMQLTNRKKDVIKSGGERISSIDLENAAVACPGVKARRSRGRLPSQMGRAPDIADRTAHRRDRHPGYRSRLPCQPCGEMAVARCDPHRTYSADRDWQNRQECHSRPLS